MYVKSIRNSPRLSNLFITVWFYIAFYALTFPNYLPASQFPSPVPLKANGFYSNFPENQAHLRNLNFLTHFETSLYLSIFPRGRSAPVLAKTTPLPVLLISNPPTTSEPLFWASLWSFLLHFQILSLSWTFLSIYIFRFPPAHSILLLLSPLGLLVKIKCILRQKSKGASLLTLLKEELIYFLLPLPHHLLTWTLELLSVPPLSNEITCSKVISILPSTKFIAFSQLLSSWTSL